MKRMALAMSLCVLSANAQAADGQISLSLKEAIRSAVEKNLDVKAELYNPATAEADVRSNRGIYDTKLTLLTNFEYSVTEPPNTFFTGTSVSRSKTLVLNPGISQLVHSGGTVGLTFNNTYTNTNTRGLPDFWQSDLTLNFSQPLLKNSGREATELNINVAKYNKEGSIERFKAKLLDTVARVRTEYNKLYSLREELEVRKVSLKLTQKILVETQSRVKAGVLPAMEILNAEFGVASREKDVIDAEKAVRDQNDVLRVLLQLQGREEIVPVDTPSKEPFRVEAEDVLMKRALDARPEIREQRTNVRSNELQARVARNRTLPDLSLNASIALNGLAERYNRDLEKIGAADFPVWSVGFQFGYPLGNSTAENDYIKSKLKVEQSQTQVRSLEANVENEVKTAIRGVESGFKQLDVTERGSVFAEERLRSFIKKNEVGLATTKDVLDVENDLATAKSNHIKALTGYSDAVTQLWRATGELLDREGVRVTEKEGDALYEKNR